MPRQANCAQVGVKMHDARIAGHDVRSCDSSLRHLVAGYMKNGTIAGLYDPEPVDKNSGRAECGVQLAAVGAAFATGILSELFLPRRARVTVCLPLFEDFNDPLFNKMQTRQERLSISLATLAQPKPEVSRRETIDGNLDLNGHLPDRLAPRGSGVIGYGSAESCVRLRPTTPQFISIIG